jgi:hypothetical protein
VANRLPLEQQTGADLIYFNEAYKSFVMVQYKAMEQGNDQAEFRWQAGDQFVQEIGRMDALLAELRKIPLDGHLEVPLDFGFRRLGALGSSVGCAFCSLIFG